MEKIIQLKESEYNKLCEKASEVEKLAQKMYEEKGTFSIVLKLDCGKDYTEQIKISAYTYVNDWDGKYPMKEDDKRKIVKFVNSRALEMMEKKFGKQINDFNLWNRRLDLLRSWKIKFIGLTIFGWLAATVLLIVALLK